MRDYEKELEDRIANLELQVNKNEITEGLNILYQLMVENGLDKDPRYIEAGLKICKGNSHYISLTCQLKAMIWQKQNLIDQVGKTKIGKYILSKCKLKQTF